MIHGFQVEPDFACKRDKTEVLLIILLSKGEQTIRAFGSIPSIPIHSLILKYISGFLKLSKLYDKNAFFSLDCLSSTDRSQNILCHIDDYFTTDCI